MEKQLLENLNRAYQNASVIKVQGEDVFAMAQVLANIKFVFEKLQEQYNTSEKESKTYTQ